MKTFLDIAMNVALGLMILQLVEGLSKRATHSILWPMPRARRGLTPLECMKASVARHARA